MHLTKHYLKNQQRIIVCCCPSTVLACFVNLMTPSPRWSFVAGFGTFRRWGFVSKSDFLVMIGLPKRIVRARFVHGLSRINYFPAVESTCMYPMWTRIVCSICSVVMYYNAMLHTMLSIFGTRLEKYWFYNFLFCIASPWDKKQDRKSWPFLFYGSIFTQKFLFYFT
jgi:hypothetical protein